MNSNEINMQSVRGSKKFGDCGARRQRPRAGAELGFIVRGRNIKN